MSRIRQFFSQRTKSFEQFPISYVVLLFIAGVLIAQVYTPYDSLLEEEFAKLILSGVFALPLTAIPGVLGRIRKNNSDKGSMVFQLIFLLVAIAFYFLLPENIMSITPVDGIPFFGGVALAYLLLFTAIAWTKTKQEEFTRLRWKEVVGSILIGGLAGGILWGGIAACIKSIEYLFNVDFNSDIYQYVGIVAMIVIGGSMIFINFINEKGDEKPVYHRILRIFGQYIFLPLTVIYGIILLSYGIKILLTGVWPEGIIIYMVLGYVGFGLLTRYTTYPALPNTFVSKAHFVLFASFALAALLMIPAIQLRIEQYGITINRYFICAIIVWIITASVGAIIFKKHRFFVLITLFIGILAFALYGGKRSATQFPIAHQKATLQRLLTKNNIQTPLTSGNFNTLTIDQKDEIRGPLLYLINNTEIQNLEGVFSAEDIQKIQKTEGASRFVTRSLICKALEIDICSYDYEYDYKNARNQYFSLYVYRENYQVDIAGYEKMYNINNKTTANNTISFGNNTFDLTEYLEDIYTKAGPNSYGKETNKEPYIITTDTIKIILFSLDGTRTIDEDGNSSYVVNYYNGFMFIKGDGTNTLEEENNTTTTGDVDTSTDTTTTEITQEIVQPPVETLPVEPIELPIVTH